MAPSILSKLSGHHEKIEHLEEQLKTDEAAISKRDDELQNRSRELEVSRKAHSDAVRALEEQQKQNKLLEARIAEIEKQRKDQFDAAQASLKRSGEESAKKHRELEDRSTALTRERDQAKKDITNAELRTKAHEYEKQRLNRQLQEANQANADGITTSTASTSALNERIAAAEKKSADSEAKSRKLQGILSR